MVPNRKDFKVSAGIDFVSVVVKLERPTQFRHVQAALLGITGKTLHVDPIDADRDAGGNAKVFDIRFHDALANDARTLAYTLTRLRERYGFAEEPAIGAIEVFADFYLRSNEVGTRNSQLLVMTHRLQTSLYAPTATKPRQWVPNGRAKPDGKPDGANRFMDNAHEGFRLDPSLNFRIGNNWDVVSWQVYFKRTNDNGMPINDQSQHRARVEVTLKGAAVQEYGLNRLSNLDDYDFRRLMPLFRFRKPVDPIKQAKGNLFVVTAINAGRRLHDANSARGMHSFESIGRTDKRGKTRAESAHIEADTELSDAVKGALRRLSVGTACEKKGTNNLIPAIASPLGSDHNRSLPPSNCSHYLQHINCR